MSGSADAIVQLGGTAALNLSLALMVGAASAMAAAAAHPRLHDHEVRWARGAMLAVAGLAMVGSALVLWWQSTAIAEVPLLDAWPALGPVLTRTHFGRAWIVDMASLVCLLLLVAPHGVPARCGRLAAAASPGIAVFAGTGSAVGHQPGGEFGIFGFIDWSHLLLVSLWAGEVFMATIWMSRMVPDGDPLSGVRAAWRIARLSTTATWTLTGVLITGALMPWNGLGTQATALISTEYGLALMTKLLLVWIAVALGSYNRFVTMPGLMSRLSNSPTQAGAEWSRFLTVLRAEAGVLVAVLLVAAVLATRSPPG